jgi:uncharacterized PurR-regulated membrane protein YhhQ (DUF165 family)
MEFRYITISCYIVVVLFSFLNNFLVSISINNKLYGFLLQPSLMLTILGPIGYFTTSFINIKLLSKLKAKMLGKHFIFRSFICSSISEVIISLILYPAIFYRDGVKYILVVVLGTTLLKILITIPFVFVAKLLVLYFRYVDNVETPLYNKNLSGLSSLNI